MNGNLTPSLFEALNRLQRRAQEFGQLLLRPSELLAGCLKLLLIHRSLPLTGATLTVIPQCGIVNQIQ